MILKRKQHKAVFNYEGEKVMYFIDDGLQEEYERLIELYPDIESLQTPLINVSDVFVLFGTAAIIYFVINFTLSLTIRGMQKRRGKMAASAQRV